MWAAQKPYDSSNDVKGYPRFTIQQYWIRRARSSISVNYHPIACLNLSYVTFKFRFDLRKGNPHKSSNAHDQRNTRDERIFERTFHSKSEYFDKIK